MSAIGDKADIAFDRSVAANVPKRTSREMQQHCRFRLSARTSYLQRTVLSMSFDQPRADSIVAE